MRPELSPSLGHGHEPSYRDDPDADTDTDTHTGWQKMGNGNPDGSTTTTTTTTQDGFAPTTTRQSFSEVVVYRVYKRRWFGLGMLMLQNIVISWGWLTYAPVSNLTQTWFQLSSETPVNWLSTVVLFTYTIISPAVVYTLSHHGVKRAIGIASLLLLLGNWVRYAGTKTRSFPTVMFGQILIGLAQPFVLSAPTYYSDLWFTSRGRISATALASLSNPVGAAVGQLVGPIIATVPGELPGMVMWVAVISTVACAPWWFVEARPPTPPCASAAGERLGLWQGVREVFKNRDFIIVLVLFSVYLGFFNAMSSLLNQIMLPYGYTADQAGITGAILIVSGLLCSAIISPIVDRTHTFLLVIKLQVPIIAVCYIALIFAVSSTSGSLVAPIIVSAILGAASFSLLPLALEWVAETTYPAPPEVTSAVLWAMGQTVGGVFLLVMDAMKDVGDGGKMKRSLVFEAVVAAVVAPLAFVLGRGSRGVNRRIAVDKAVAAGEEEVPVRWAAAAVGGA